PLPVGAAVIGGRGHRRQIGLALGGTDRYTCQLAIGYGNAVVAHGVFHLSDVIGADLVAESARAGVDHDADRVLCQSHLCGRGRVVDAVDGLYFQEVVAGAEAADLTEPAFDGPVADRGRVGALEHATVFASLEVACDTVSLVHREPGATGQHVFQHNA